MASITVKVLHDLVCTPFGRRQSRFQSQGIWLNAFRILAIAGLGGFMLIHNAIAADAAALLTEDAALSESLQRIVVDLELDREFSTEDGAERISLAVIDLKSKPPRLGGVYADNFIYPASVYKMYVAAGVLKLIVEERANLDSPFVVKDPNVVDTTRENWERSPAAAGRRR